MAGGSFDVLRGKVRPGTYINFEGSARNPVGGADRGTVLIPLVGHDYGPENEFIRIGNGAPDGAREKLGYSVFDAGSGGMLLIREAFKKAAEVIVFVPKSGAEKAEAVAGNLHISAKYSGSRGNAFKVAIISAEPGPGFNVRIFLDGRLVEEFAGVTDAEELAGSGWVDFSGAGKLAKNAGVSLSGGTDGIAAGGDVAEFFDGCEGVNWNTMACPFQELNAAVLAKIRYLREEAGKYRKAVCADFAADYEGIINVTNGVRLEDGTVIDAAAATAWVAGLDASSENTRSNTFVPYEGAAEVYGLKSHSASAEAIRAGEFFFSASDEGRVVVEYDINSLVTYGAGRNALYSKNRILRVFDSFGEAVKLHFPPNKYGNSSVGWDIMEGIGKTILKRFEEAGALTNVDYDSDFKVNRALSRGDSTYISVALQAVDSAEKLYFEIKTN